MEYSISESDFIAYMHTQRQKSANERGLILISLNISNLVPVTNVAFISREFLFSAKYNDKSGTYSNGFFVNQQNIKRYNLQKGIFQDELMVETDVLVTDQEEMQLKMSFPKISVVGWHKRNLKMLKSFIC